MQRIHLCLQNTPPKNIVHDKILTARRSYLIKLFSFEFLWRSILLITCRLHDFHLKYVEKYFTREPHKNRNESIFENFRKLNKRNAEEFFRDIEQKTISKMLFIV